jgi:hypothetical protein
MSNKYLRDVLDSQAISDDSDKMKMLRACRDDLEKLLRKRFDKSDLTIRDIRGGLFPN